MRNMELSWYALSVERLKNKEIIMRDKINMDKIMEFSLGDLLGYVSPVIDVTPKRFRGFEPVVKEHLKIYSSNESVVLPLRGTETSAGYDFVAPIDIDIAANEGVLLWTDVKAYMLDDEVLELYPRGSIGNKRFLRMKNTVGIIDSDYYSNVKNDGNIGLFLWNFGKEIQSFSAGDPIVQGIFKKFLESDNCNTEVKRTGGHGSTSEKETE